VETKGTPVKDDRIFIEVRTKVVDGDVIELHVPFEFAHEFDEYWSTNYEGTNYENKPVN
jgi:hypothetical protein